MRYFNSLSQIKPRGITLGQATLFKKKNDLSLPLSQFSLQGTRPRRKQIKKEKKHKLSYAD